jgi:uncharacterized protein YggT (Ycf19 family)
VSLPVGDAKKGIDFVPVLSVLCLTLLRIALMTLIDYILWINRKYIK